MVLSLSKLLIEIMAMLLLLICSEGTPLRGTWLVYVRMVGLSMSLINWILHISIMTRMGKMWRFMLSVCTVIFEKVASYSLISDTGEFACAALIHFLIRLFGRHQYQSRKVYID